MNCKTGAEHIKSLQDGRTVYLDGKLVGDVTVHPAFRNSIKSSGMLYDFQAREENIELMTFQPNGANRRVNRAWQMPRNYAEMVQRRKAMQAWARCSYGFMGRSPDHLASAIVGQVMGIDVFEKHGPARAKALRDYYEEASRNDYFLTYVIINPQAERGKDWGEQAEDLVARIVDEDAGGITIRGAKMLGTSSIMANDVFVANLQPLKAGEEALAFSCAVPMNSKGLRVLSRKSYEAHAVSVFDNPLSSRFDENDALIYFDDVKVPWERVFVHRDPDMCRAQFHDTPGHAYQNYQAQIRLSVKIKFLCGLAHKLTEAIGTTNMPPVREQLGFLAAQVSMVNAMMSGMEAEGTMRGEYYVPNRHFMYSAQVLTQDLYPKVINTIRDLAGGALIMLPSSVHDFEDPMIAKIIGLTQRAAKMAPEEKVKFLKAAWDAIGSEFGSRHTQYEMFYAGARFVTTGHSYRTFDWADATGMVDDLMKSYQLADELPKAAN
jgi:4-hydroxyphenylacetate 3-monooxygenase